MGQNLGGAQRINEGYKNEGMVGERSLQKVIVSGIDAGVSHCQEGLKLLVLVEGRRWESVALPHWASVYPVACCTLEGLRRETCTQTGNWMPDQGGEQDLPVPWGCIPRSCRMASWPLPMGVAGHRAGEGGQGLCSLGL